MPQVFKCLVSYINSVSRIKSFPLKASKDPGDARRVPAGQDLVAEREQHWNSDQSVSSENDSVVLSSLNIIELACVLAWQDKRKKWM